MGKPIVMKREAPIAVRPRKGSDLERVWDENDRNAASMRDLIHGWARMFKNMVAESDRENDA